MNPGDMPDTGERLRLVAAAIADHKAAIKALAAERDDLIQQRRSEVYSFREIGADAGLSHIRVREILAGPLMTGQMPIPWDYLQENLVTLAEISRRLKLNRVTASAWAKVYDDGSKYYPDWPDPVLTFEAHSGSGTSGFFWWPDIQAWCTRHDVTVGKGLPRGRPGKGKASLALLPAVSTG